MLRIMRYPLISTRKDKEFYDEFECQPEEAMALVEALRAVDKEHWYWFEVGSSATPTNSEEPVESPILLMVSELLAS